MTQLNKQETKNLTTHEEYQAKTPLPPLSTEFHPGTQERGPQQAGDTKRKDNIGERRMNKRLIVSEGLRHHLNHEIHLGDN